MSLLFCRSYHLMTICVFGNRASTMKNVSQCWSLAMHQDLFPVIQSFSDPYTRSQHLLADAQGVLQVGCLIQKYDHMCRGIILSDNTHQCSARTISCDVRQQNAQWYSMCIISLYCSSHEAFAQHTHSLTLTSASCMNYLYCDPVDLRGIWHVMCFSPGHISLPVLNI
jgi:hypothetical protein